MPAEARWAGGADGGSWILCRRSSETTVGRAYRCDVYHDFTGELEMSGRFICDDCSLPDDATKNCYKGFDGTHIYLCNGKSLVPDGRFEYPDVDKWEEYDNGELVREGTR